jgi:hypothetical protein
VTPQRTLELHGIALTGVHQHGVHTGAEFAERLARHQASGYGPLPVGSALSALFPSGGLERGHIYGCRGDASLSVLYALSARATQAGSWVATVNLFSLGLMSAREHGVALQRLLCVDAGTQPATWTQVMGACVDGLDVVVAYAPQCSLHDARRIEARLKAHGSVLIIVGDPGVFSPAVVLSSHTTQWEFSTHASRREVDVVATGRRVHGQRQCALTFTGHDQHAGHLYV